MKVPVAAQVYSVREEAAADFEKTMQQLADMGYDGVELAGLYGKICGRNPQLFKTCWFAGS